MNIKHTSFACESKLNGVSASTTESINNYVAAATIRDMFTDFLRCDGKPTLCKSNSKLEQ